MVWLRNTNDSFSKFANLPRLLIYPIIQESNRPINNSPEARFLVLDNSSYSPFTKSYSTTVYFYHFHPVSVIVSQLVKNH